jgi:hypothetical protein
VASTCFVWSEGELPVVAVSVFIAAHTISGYRAVPLLLRRIDDLRSCRIAIEKDPELEIIFEMCVTGLYRQHKGEFGTANCFHVTFGVVFVESVAVDMDRNAHFGQAVCAHGGGRVVVA